MRAATPRPPATGFSATAPRLHRTTKADNDLAGQQVAPEPGELERVTHTYCSTGHGAGDDVADQHPDGRTSPQFVGQILGFNLGDDVVVAAVKEEHGRGWLRRTRWRQRGIAAVGTDVRQQPDAEVHDVASSEIA